MDFAMTRGEEGSETPFNVREDTVVRKGCGTGIFLIGWSTGRQKRTSPVLRFVGIEAGSLHIRHGP